MATKGLRDLFFANCNEDPTTGNETFGTMERLAKIISTKISVETAEGSIYADDGADLIENEVTGGSVELEVSDLTEEMQAKVCGHTTGDDGGIYVASDDSAPYVAIAMRSKKAGKDGKYKYIVLYKCKFSVPDIEGATRGEKIEYKTPTLKGKFIPLNKNNRCLKLATSLPTVSPGLTWFSAVSEDGTDSTALSVSSVTPAADATGVDKATTVKWVFSKSLRQSSVTADNFYLTKSTGGAKIAGALAYDDTTKTVTFTPTSALAATTQYIATADTDVADAAGVLLGTASITSFTTGA